MLSNSKEIPLKNNEKNQLKYISTYKMGQIGITKLIEEPFKASISKENNLQQQIQKNIVPSNTNTNTNNTNSNTNTNTYKAIDNNSNKKIIKNHFSASHNVIHIQSFSNINYHKNNKNKSNPKTNLINNNNDKKQKYESNKLIKKQFSKTTNNLGLYLNNNNLYNKDSYKNLYCKTRIKSKSNNKVQSESGCSNYILSSRTPNSIKRNQKKYAIANFIEDEKNKTNINSFKKDNIYDLYLKTSNNQSCIDIKPNSKKFKEKQKFDSNYQLTEFNTYLKVRKRDDIQSQKHANSNIKTESNKLLSSCFFNNEKKSNKSSDKKDNIYLSQVLSTENNIKKKSNIKLIYDSNKNTNRLLTENNQKQNNFSPYFIKNIFCNENSNTNINTNKNRFISQTNKRKNSSKPNLNISNNNNKFGSKTYLNIKNKEDNDSKPKDKKEEKLNNINSVNKNNYNNKYKSRKNYSTNTSKKKPLKDSSSINKKNNDNIRYNSFIRTNNNNLKNEKKKKDEVNNSMGIKDLKFECPEEVHFFMVNLTHNCINVISKF